MKPPVIILVTVNDHETHAVLDAFCGEHKEPEHLTRGGITYNNLGIHGGHHVIHTVCEMGAGGIGASQQRTREAIEHWQPRAIIAVGIAFGVDENKQKVGDVLVSLQIQEYDLGRLNADGMFTARGDKPGSADILRNRLRQGYLAGQRGSMKWPKVQFGLLLSGQKLVDNLDYRESLKSLFPEAIGGEMEGTGVYVSALQKKVDWIVVKAICDWAYNKNQADKDAWQQLAAKNAACVVKKAVDLGCLYDSTSFQDEKTHSKVDSGLTPPKKCLPLKQAPSPKGSGIGSNELANGEQETVVELSAWSSRMRRSEGESHRLKFSWNQLFEMLAPLISSGDLKPLLKRDLEEQLVRRLCELGVTTGYGTRIEHAEVEEGEFARIICRFEKLGYASQNVVSVNFTDFGRQIAEHLTPIGENVVIECLARSSRMRPSEAEHEEWQLSWTELFEMLSHLISSGASKPVLKRDLEAQLRRKFMDIGRTTSYGTNIAHVEVRQGEFARIIYQFEKLGYVSQDLVSVSFTDLGRKVAG